jgi:hypothetical protein
VLTLVVIAKPADESLPCPKISDIRYAGSLSIKIQQLSGAFSRTAIINRKKWRKRYIFFLSLSFFTSQFWKKKKYGMENIHSKKIKRKRKHGTRENMRTRAFGYNSAKCSQQFEFFFLVEKKN